VPNDDYVVLVRLQRTNRKIGKIVTLYQREFLKKILRQAHFVPSTQLKLDISEGSYLLHTAQQNKTHGQQ
jgi:hypothetical protein